MAGDLSSAFANRVYDWLMRPGETVTRPSAIYAALLVSGTEVSGGSYARVNVTTSFGAPSAGVGSNTGAITFPSPTANWGTVNQVQLFDASSGGNALTVAKSLTTPRTINNGDAAPSFAIGDFDVTVS